MRKSALIIAALLAAGSLAAAAYATATIGSQAVTTLATGSLPETSHPGNSRSNVSPIRCWKTWQSVRDALLHHTTPAGCHTMYRSTQYRVVSKLYRYSMILPGNTARWFAEYASDNWTDTTIPGTGDPQLDTFQDRQTGRVYLIATRPATSLQAWTNFVASAHPGVCSGALTLPTSTVGGSPARVLTWSCSDGFPQVLLLTAVHAHRGYILLVASPTSSRAANRSAFDAARRSFKFLHSVG